jgi:hypothetical protein
MTTGVGDPSDGNKKAYQQQYYQCNREFLLAKNTLSNREYRRLNDAMCKEKAIKYYYKNRDQILLRKREAYHSKIRPPPECRISLIGFKSNVTLVFD